MEIRIEGFDLPGRECGPAPGTDRYENIHVGVQRRGRPEELLGLTPGDAPTAGWTLDCDVSTTSDGADFRGPYIQGRKHDRFVYLSWGEVDTDGSFKMFRRAKLMFDAVPPDVLRAAIESCGLRARLGLSDGKGHPLCAAVRPPRVTWTTYLVRGR